MQARANAKLYDRTATTYCIAAKAVAAIPNRIVTTRTPKIPTQSVTKNRLSRSICLVVSGGPSKSLNSCSKFLLQYTKSLRVLNTGSSSYRAKPLKCISCFSRSLMVSESLTGKSRSSVQMASSKTWCCSILVCRSLRWLIRCNFWPYIDRLRAPTGPSSFRWSTKLFVILIWTPRVLISFTTVSETSRERSSSIAAIAFLSNCSATTSESDRLFDHSMQLSFTFVRPIDVAREQILTPSQRRAASSRERTIVSRGASGYLLFTTTSTRVVLAVSWYSLN
jgi:hypothetical protein